MTHKFLSRYLASWKAQIGPIASLAFVSRVSLSLFVVVFFFFFRDSCPSVLYCPNFNIHNEVCVGVIFKNLISIKNFIFCFSVFIFHFLEEITLK